MTQSFIFAKRPEGFDNHIDQSIRGYSDLIDDVLKLSEYFVEDDTNVVDVGCSTGKMLKTMVDQNTFAKRVNYIGVELEENFVSGWDEYIGKVPALSFLHQDIRDYDFQNCSFVSSIFTLLFMPQHERSLVIRRIYNGLQYGGAFVFSEKTLADSAKIQDIRTFIYYDHKRKSFTE